MTKTLRLQVYKQYLLWAPKYINMTYFGLFGASGKHYENTGSPYPLSTCPPMLGAMGASIGTIEADTKA